jgi:dipeptidyl aminopeptidase/acylaminoacyl peptidase
VDDELGPRDLVRLGGRIAARVLIIHGRDDDVIPVGQSRALRDGLLRAGRDVEYVETPTGGHDPLRGGQGPGLTDRMLRFLLADERG